MYFDIFLQQIPTGMRYPNVWLRYPKFSLCYAIRSQVPMCVVAPGKQPVTAAERALSTSSGHIIHLMPGDNHYDPSSFSIVIAWNGLDHYIPTYIIRKSSILQHRCSVISKLLSTATNLFGTLSQIWMSLMIMN